MKSPLIIITTTIALSTAMTIPVFSDDGSLSPKQSVQEKFDKLNPHLNRSWAGNLTGPKVSPLDEAKRSISKFRSDLQKAESNFEAQIKELEGLSKTDISEAKQIVEDASKALSGFLNQIEDGGTLQQAVQQSLHWMKANRDLTSSDHRLKAEQRDRLLNDWRHQIQEMINRSSELETVRGTLKSELHNLASSKAFMEHMVMIGTAASMNEVVNEMIKSMRGTISAIQSFTAKDQLPGA